MTLFFRHCGKGVFLEFIHIFMSVFSEFWRLYPPPKWIAAFKQLHILRVLAEPSKNRGVGLIYGPMTTTFQRCEHLEERRDAFSVCCG